MDSPGQEATWIVAASDAGDRIDRWLAHRAGVSRRQARLWIAQGLVRLDGRSVRILSRELRAGARVELRGGAASPAPHPEAREPVLLALDAQLVVVDKPAGLLSEHDRSGAPSLESLVPGLLARRGERRTDVRLVHRLDAGTTGVMVLARTPAATRALNAAFAAGQVHKTYLALCVGRLAEAVRVDAPIGRVAGARHGVVAGGKPARTVVEPIAVGERATLVRARPETGRTHQIRVHLAHLGHPLLGDRAYGGPGYSEGVPPQPIGRPMLHAQRLELVHPRTGESVSFSAAPAADLIALAEAYGVWPAGAL